MPSPTPTTPTRSQTSLQASTLRVKTHVKAGSVTLNHNATLVQAPRPAVSLKVKTHVKAGGVQMNHNEALVPASLTAAGLRGKTHPQAGCHLSGSSEV